MDIVVKNGLCISGGRSITADILLQQGRIAAVEPSINVEKLSGKIRIIDADGLYVLPGLIDAHTHYHLVSRGTVTADSFPEGSRLAAFGGVTTVIDFSDHQKNSTLRESMSERRKAMKQGMVIDFALHQGVYRMHDGMHQELKELKESGVSAVKIFTTYKNVGYLINTSQLRKLFTACRDLQIMVCVHAEDDLLIEQLAKEHGEAPFKPSDHPKLRPAKAEAQAIEYVGELAWSIGMPIYIVHLSSEEGLNAVEKLRKRGGRIYAETTPHYLQLTRDLLDREDAPLFIMTPPLRTNKDNEALWKGIAEGSVSIAATDHCAFTREQKLSSKDCRSILPGIPGTEEMLPLLHTFGVASGKITMHKLVELISENPARAFGLYPR
ncbi:MAG: amidohydrolase family protein, partial [Spirochaetales bacterium]|nr:amidohydrolase family protein [Spirochaetales bacterium]